MTALDLVVGFGLAVMFGLGAVGLATVMLSAWGLLRDLLGRRR